MTDDEQDHEPNGSTPLAVRLIYRYGVPAGIALFLTYFLTQQVSVNVASVAAQVEDMRTEHLELRWFLRAICLNTAETEAQRASCVPPNEAR